MEKEFTLTQGHILHGLKREDFERYAGYPVGAGYLQAYPHWDVLASQGWLSPAQTNERAEVMYRDLAAQGLADRSGGPFEYEDAVKQAGYVFPTVYAQKTAFPLSDEADICLTSHFQKLGTEGDKAVHREESFSVDDGPRERRLVVVPGTFGEPAAAQHIEFLFSVFVLLESPQGKPDSFWSRRTGLPADRLSGMTELSCAGHGSLFVALHEMRHLRQGLLWPDNWLYSYYTEMDADAFAARTLGAALSEQETLKTYRHARYMALLRTSPQYWFAPSLDDFESGREVTKYPAVYLAVTSLRAKLFAEATNDGKRFACHVWDLARAEDKIIGKSGMYLQDEKLRKIAACSNVFFSVMFREQFRREPEVLFSLLRRLAEREAFRHPLSKRIAERIVEAANFFNPALTEERDPAGKIRIPGANARRTLHHVCVPAKPAP